MNNEERSVSPPLRSLRGVREGLTDERRERMTVDTVDRPLSLTQP